MFKSTSSTNGHFPYEDYADINYFHGHCDDDARTPIEDNRRRFPERGVKDQLVLINVHRNLRESVKFPQPRREELLGRNAYLVHEDTPLNNKYYITGHLYITPEANL